MQSSSPENLSACVRALHSMMSFRKTVMDLMDLVRKREAVVSEVGACYTVFPFPLTTAHLVVVLTLFLVYLRRGKQQLVNQDGSYPYAIPVGEEHDGAREVLQLSADIVKAVHDVHVAYDGARCECLF